MKTIALILASLVSFSALADGYEDHDEHQNSYPQYGYESDYGHEDQDRYRRPEVRYERAYSPRREYYDDRQASSERSYGGAIIGGIAGALLGNRIGGGTGRVAATAIGAATGALVGDNMSRR